MLHNIHTDSRRRIAAAAAATAKAAAVAAARTSSNQAESIYKHNMLAEFMLSARIVLLYMHEISYDEISSDRRRLG